MIQLVVFDFDGTLCDTREDIADAVNFARQKFALPPLSLPEVTAMVGNGIAVLTERAFAGWEVDLRAAQERILDYYSSYPACKACLYPGVRETLPGISSTLTIVSNKPESIVRAILERTALGHFFDFVAGGETFVRKKPDVMALDYLLAKYRVARADVVVVGDHTPDIEMARRAGVRSVYCNYGFFGHDEFGADFQISEFRELLQVLRRMESGPGPGE